MPQAPGACCLREEALADPVMLTTAGGLRVRAYRDVLLTPASAPPLRFGAFDAAGAPIEAFGLRRRVGLILAPSVPPGPAPQRLAGRHVYGGLAVHNFGHFLAESVARLWALPLLGELPLLWHVHPKLSGGAIASWRREIFTLLAGGDGTHLDIDRPLLVEEVLVPEPGHILGVDLHPEQAGFLARHTFKAPRAGRRLWLSRSALQRKAAEGTVAGEEALEARLAAAGWEVLHPQRLSVAAQLRAYEDAEVLAGFMGSAFHSLLLGRDVRARVVMLDRGIGAGATENYEVIAAAKGFRQDIIRVPLTLLGAGRAGPTATWRLDDPDGAAAVVCRAADGLDTMARAP